MNWDEVWAEGVAPALLADPIVSAIMGDRIYLVGSRHLELPSITALQIVDTETENWAPCDWQFDVYAKTSTDVREVARAIRRLFHHDVQYELGPFLLWGEFLEGRDFGGPETDGWFRYSMDFRFTPGRSLYLTAQES